VKSGVANGDGGCQDHRKRNVGQSTGILVVMHRHVRRLRYLLKTFQCLHTINPELNVIQLISMLHRQCLAFPLHGVQEWRRCVPHPLHHCAALHWQAIVFSRNGHGSILQLWICQGLGDCAHSKR
jgi:hypothetical protein